MMEPSTFFFSFVHIYEVDLGYKLVFDFDRNIPSVIWLSKTTGDSFSLFSCIYFLCIIRLRTTTFYIFGADFKQL